MTAERIHNVYQTSIGVIEEVYGAPREWSAARAVAAQHDTGAGLVGRWVVRDHTDTILALCGPMGRAG